MKAPAWNGSWHPLADRFPMMDEDELRDMAASITERGQYVPCRMGPDGLGYDGRNRVAACALAGVEPQWEVYDGDAVAFIVEVNAERRHLTTGQRAMAVAIGLAEAGKRTAKGWKRGSLPSANGRSSDSAWVKALGEAGVVLDHAPDLADPVLRGDMALDAAWKQADDIHKRRERLVSVGGELSALVESDVITLDEAEQRAADALRIAQLPDELADRVRGGALTLGEAEVIAAENEARVAAWANEIRAALTTLTRMAGHPVPGGLAEHLSADERRTLTVALAALTTSKGE